MHQPPTTRKAPIALFDNIEHIEGCKPPAYLTPVQRKDFLAGKSFLMMYLNNSGTYNSYRREVERLLHWTWHINNQRLKDTTHIDCDKYIRYCMNPPMAWIGVKTSSRFIDNSGHRLPNDEWRPFVAKRTKAETSEGKKAEKNDYEPSRSSTKQLITICGVFYTYLVEEGHIRLNPLRKIKQTSSYFPKSQNKNVKRVLSPFQMESLIKTTTEMANRDPVMHERSLFMIVCLYRMFLRISELCASNLWTPTMKDFSCDQYGNWWFYTVSKGNKSRSIAVSDAVLSALKRWRRHQGLSPLPAPDDNSYLIPAMRGKGPLSDTTHIREIVQKCIDETIEHLKSSGKKDDANAMRSVTVHWLRHTGISHEVKVRPKDHVRNDAGHSSSAITDIYIDVDDRERHQSAQVRKIINN